MFAFGLSCCIPILLAPIGYLEHRAIQYLREGMGYRDFPYFMGSVMIYLAPIAFMAMLAVIAGVVIVVDANRARRNAVAGRVRRSEGWEPGRETCATLTS